MFVLARSSVARVRKTVFSLDNDLHGGRLTFHNFFSGSSTLRQTRFWKRKGRVARDLGTIAGEAIRWSERNSRQRDYRRLLQPADSEPGKGARAPALHAIQLPAHSVSRAVTQGALDQRPEKFRRNSISAALTSFGRSC